MALHRLRENLSVLPEMTAADVQRDLCRVIDDVPVVFTINAVEYVGTRGSLVSSKRVMDGGIFEEPALTITTSLKKINSSGKLVDRFSTEPALGNKLESVGGVSGQDFRIVRLHKDEFSAAVQMDLESVNK